MNHPLPHFPLSQTGIPLMPPSPGISWMPLPEVLAGTAAAVLKRLPHKDETLGSRFNL